MATVTTTQPALKVKIPGNPTLGMANRHPSDMSQDFNAPAHAVMFVQEEYSPFLFPHKFDEANQAISLGVALITERGITLEYDVATVSYASLPPKVSPGKNRGLYEAVFLKQRCPRCSSTLMTKMEYNMATSAGHGIRSIAGILDDNKYCPNGWDTHGFWCAQHGAVHKERCNHDVPETDDWDTRCLKCGDIVLDGVKLIREVRDQ